MVLFMHQPVQYIPHPAQVRDKDKVWALSQTGEIFLDYGSYLQRRDFYLQKKFTCEVTAVSGLTFFDALDSELEGNRSTTGNFPEPLREPVLRKLQFSTLPRIDDLVNLVFDEFGRDFFPGETVIVSSPSGDTAEGIIREKITIRERKGADGVVLAEAASHYFVRMSARPGHLRETFLDSHQLSRDRRFFTKPILRTFLKNSLTREPWPGAPWNIVKEVAREYHIDTDFPQHMRRGQPVSRRPAGHRSLDFSYPRPGYGSGFHPFHGRHENGAFADHFDNLNLDNSSHLPSHFNSAAEPLPPPPPPIKYPIEDLNIPGNGSQRPKLKFLTSHTPSPDDDDSEPAATLRPESVGPLLEVWNMLNIYKDVFVLDSFTFDDLLDAITIFSPTIQSELVVEVHCAILSQLVSTQGDLLIDLPEDESEEEESGDDGEGSADEEEVQANGTESAKNGTDENDAEKTGDGLPNSDRSTSSRHVSGSARSRSEDKTSECASTIEPDVHRATELIMEYNWVDMLKARDFRTGGWEVILAGLLCQLSLDEHFKSRCDDVLAHLVPLDSKPSHTAVKANYRTLDINLRISALEMISMLAVQTRAIREHMDLCNERMTEYRKEKIEHQRKRKILLEELRELDEQRRTIRQEVSAIREATPIPVLPADAPSDVKPETDDKDDDEGPTRLTRWANERKRKREEDKIKKELDAKLSRPEMALKKLDGQAEKKINQVKECENAVNALDDKLRVANIQRTRFLGRDRFWNKYYWFERTGMAFAPPEPESSASAGFMNGRVWVQGPDKTEVAGFLSLSDSEMAEYVSRIGEDIPTRRSKEENGTVLEGPHSWGFFDNPTELDALIDVWLDERGVREKSLLKELRLWRDRIATCMRALQKYRAGLGPATTGSSGPDADSAEPSQPQEKPAPVPVPTPAPATTRSSSRLKSAQQAAAAAAAAAAELAELHPSQRWTNNAARLKFGYLHSEAGKPKKGGNKKGVVAAQAAMVVAAVATVSTTGAVTTTGAMNSAAGTRTKSKTAGR